ncbi:UNVERIFIED_CONTAM: Secreted RxLR effector protein [Sesamum calycinum]|uniref:Secreted RxLR effector protein n=1 Tax=Sesamum calycinum TaxID=2727403 RepID=A0AAW2K8D7_9LAMI
MDIDYAIRKIEPAPTETSEPSEVDLSEKWERSNCLSVMFIKTKISGSIQRSVNQHNYVQSQPSTSFNGLIIVVHNTLRVETRVEQPLQTVPHVDDHEPVHPVVPHIPKNIKQPVDQQAPPENVDATLKRSTWIKRSTIPSDYMVYLQEFEFNIRAKHDPEVFSQAMRSRESNLCFAGCVDSRKSTFGYIFMIVSGVVSWMSAKQTLIATSTMEVEFVSCFEATSYGVWLKSFISGSENNRFNL